MSERGERSSPNGLGETFAAWRAALAAISRDETAEALRLLEASLPRATSAEELAGVRRELAGLVAAGDAATGRLRDLLARVEALERDWLTAQRYTELGLSALQEELARALAERPAEGARRWLNEIVDAFRASEWEALARIAEGPLSFPPELRPGADRVRAALAAWTAGRDVDALDLWEDVAAGELPGWTRVLDVALRSRADRVAAWIALRRLGDLEGARSHLDRAVELDPYSGPNYAERAAFFLFVGDLEEAATDAQRAIELAPADPAGYLQLGTWAELSGQFADARELFRQGLASMPARSIATMSSRASLLDAPGSLLVAAAEALLRAGQPEDALAAVDAALHVGVRGAHAYPDAEAHRVRSLALEALPEPDLEAAAAAAVEAGRRHLWNAELPAAVEQLRRGIALGAGGEAGWLLADALNAQSFAPGAAAPDQELVAEAKAVWTDWYDRVGPPSAATAWAYLTRAGVLDNEGYRLDAETEVAQWLAAADVERALVHDDANGNWWGFAAKYLRAAGLEELAFEASERADELGSKTRNVLTERLALLANRGRFADATAVAEEIVALYGSDPWISGVQAWLAYHEGRFEDALPLFEAPLAIQYDLGWYHNLRAFCRLALGAVPAALADFRATTERSRPTGGDEKCELATAHAALGEVDEARRWLAAAEEDGSTGELGYATCAVQVALAAGDAEAAAGFLERAVAAATNERELDDLEGMTTTLFLRATGGGDSLLGAVTEALERLVPPRRAWLRRHPATADAELADRLEKHDDGASGSALEPAALALLAIDARRKSGKGELEAAADTYERLLSSAFEPEAGVAFVRVLEQASRDAAALGDVERVRRVQERLRGAGAADGFESGLAVATALEAAGRSSEAREELAALESAASHDEHREVLHRQLGELALTEGDLTVAAAELASALELARRGGDSSRIAQLEARLGLAALLARDGSASSHVHAALEAWRDAGAFEPAWTLVEEVRGLLGDERSKAISQQAGAALGELFRHLEKEGKLAAFADAGPEQLSRLLEPESLGSESG